VRTYSSILGKWMTRDPSGERKTGTATINGAGIAGNTFDLYSSSLTI
jgi:hypothetical protein